MLRFIFAAFCLFAMLPGRALHAAESVTIFAAASTQQAVEVVIRACPEQVGVTCRGVYAASSTLARQIKNGAPADIFISANLTWMDYATESGVIVPNTRHIIARNQLVAIAPRMRAPKIDSTAMLLDWLAADRVALGDPAHVPAGIYAAEALTSMQAWVSDDVVAVYTIPDSLHAPILYSMGQVAGRTTPGTEDVAALFTGETGRSAFRDAGFQVLK